MSGTHKTVAGRFNVMTFGLVAGFLLGVYMIRDYQLIKYEPPNPDNFDKDGNWKEKSFIKVRLTDVAPLTKKSDTQVTSTATSNEEVNDK